MACGPDLVGASSTDRCAKSARSLQSARGATPTEPAGLGRPVRGRRDPDAKGTDAWYPAATVGLMASTAVLAFVQRPDPGPSQLLRRRVNRSSFLPLGVSKPPFRLKRINPLKHALLRNKRSAAVGSR